MKTEFEIYCIVKPGDDRKAWQRAHEHAFVGLGFVPDSHSKHPVMIMVMKVNIYWIFQGHFHNMLYKVKVNY